MKFSNEEIQTMMQATRLAKEFAVRTRDYKSASDNDKLIAVMQNELTKRSKKTRRTKSNRKLVRVR